MRTDKFKKSTICINISTRLMLSVQSVIDFQGSEFEALHEVHTAGHYYRLVLYYVKDNGTDHAARLSHIFDIQMMLDMREDAEQYVIRVVTDMCNKLRKADE